MNYRKQKYSACQLIAAINARIFFGGGDISESLFESLVDIVRCRYGGALQVRKAYNILGLEIEDGPIRVTWIERNLPVELTIHSPHYGFHSVLVEKISYTAGLASVPVFHLINNDPDDKVTWVDLHNMIPKWEHNQRCRSFKPKWSRGDSNP